MVDATISWIVQTLASSALVLVAFVAVRSTAVGERFLNYHLERKIAELKNSHEEKIEALRADFAHLQDRGRRANELEFEALTKVWNSYVDAWIKTQQAIVEYQSYPDLNKLSSDDFLTFLESTELSVPQRKQIVEAADKNAMYSKILRLRTVNIAGAAIYDGRQTLRANGIFIPASILTSFTGAFQNLSGAQVERYIAFQHGKGDYEKSMEVLDTNGTGEIAALQALVRSTIRRD